MKSETWKILAIVFIVLFLVENIYLGVIFNLAEESIEREAECTRECVLNEECFSYYYDSVSNICEGYDSSGNKLRE